MSEINNMNSNNKLVDDKRRSFTKAGIAAPVIMTLASRPVFGAQCMSAMMSGNLSNHEHDSECAGGMSPIALAEPRSIPVWEQAGFHYGNISTSKKRVINTLESKKRQLREEKIGEDAIGQEQGWEKYVGGTGYNEAGFTGNEDRSLREILNSTDASDSDMQIYITGLLNASYYEAQKRDSISNESYMFSVEEFWQIYNGTLSIPGNISLKDLIISGYTNG